MKTAAAAVRTTAMRAAAMVMTAGMLQLLLEHARVQLAAAQQAGGVLVGPAVLLPLCRQVARVIAAGAARRRPHERPLRQTAAARTMIERPTVLPMLVSTA